MPPSAAVAAAGTTPTTTLGYEKVPVTTHFHSCIDAFVDSSVPKSSPAKGGKYLFIRLHLRACLRADHTHTHTHTHTQGKNKRLQALRAFPGYILCSVFFSSGMRVLSHGGRFVCMTITSSVHWTYPSPVLREILIIRAGAENKDGGRQASIFPPMSPS
ncbi:hypothetical protein F4778DRAFT_742582 [Xylariomycetidae sp. FL2044]|nr:hypothetical protein F4778DRAFT_742582 [Xylariomycetidae sp. FL2044]